nr:hypothetical protein BaRGS_003049 [Batillaria attramentaria]
MGLQDSLMTQVVAAHDVLKGKGNNSTMSAASSSGRMPNLENDLRDLGIGDGNNAGGGSDLDNGVNMGRRSMHRSASRHSLTSVNSDVFLSATTPRTNTPPPKAEEPAEKKEQVTMWKGDRQILAIDLKKELTSKVKHRITTTTTALERVTGMGDDNEQRPYSCHLQEFPSYIDDDFALDAQNPAKTSHLSPQLSHVIKTDIQVRMGRPRYHEIRVRDLELWNRGQTLDRAHRNLKVFNWLHSLKEDEFDAASVQQTINDVPPDLEEVTFGEMVLIRAVDEPDVKPLFERKKQQYIRAPVRSTEIVYLKVVSTELDAIRPTDN